MGQLIKVEPQQIGTVVIFATDRSITSQDGNGYARGDAPSAEGGSFPEQLAARIFMAVDDLDHVWIASNQVVVERDAGWTDAAIDETAAIIADFFRFYPEG